MKGRLPLVLSVAALVVALAGGPLQAVAQTVVDFARNADKVDGIHAARTPRANRLLPLNDNARVPRAAIPPHRLVTAAVAGPVDVGTSMRSLAGVNLRPGTYLLIGKAWFRNDGSSATPLTCRLAAGTAFDETLLRLQGSAVRNARSLALPLTLAHRFTTAGRAELRCRDFGGAVKAFQIKVTALSTS